MITFRDGDILSENVDALVNTVNTEGVSGKGIALQFKLRFPENYKAYRNAAKRGDVELGKVMPVWVGGMDGPKWIINFPTKGHWRAKSKLGDIEMGLSDLVRIIRDLDIQSIAVPPLGCGNGGLEWRDVRPLIERALGGLDGVDVHLFAPTGAPLPAEMRVKTKKPNMTLGRSTVIVALGDYIDRAAAGATRLVVQKLAYLLQEAGVPLKLSFAKAQFGPYAEQMNFVLQEMEGHYTSGYGDRTQPTSIFLEPGAMADAESYLEERPEMRASLGRVAAVIEDLESPYGLELLTTVHFVATHDDPRAVDQDQAIAMVQAWSQRKGALFTDRHIALAWQRLNDLGWLDGQGATTAKHR